MHATRRAGENCMRLAHKDSRLRRAADAPKIAAKVTERYFVSLVLWHRPHLFIRKQCLYVFLRYPFRETGVPDAKIPMIPCTSYCQSTESSQRARVKAIHIQVRKHEHHKDSIIVVLNNSHNCPVQFSSYCLPFFSMPTGARTRL